MLYSYHHHHRRRRRRRRRHHHHRRRHWYRHNMCFILFNRDDVFAVSIDLSPGEYIFKYFVDDEWKIRKDQVLS